MNMSSYSCCVSPSKESSAIESLVGILKIVAEKNRLRLLCILRDGEHCVCELMEHVDLSQSLISHHLKDLKEVGVVKDQKRRLRVYYSLTPKGMKVTDLLFTIPHIEGT